MAGVLGAYVLLGPVWNARLSVRIGEEPSHTPGYSLLVGLNPDSGGRWNQEDSDRLGQQLNGHRNSFWPMQRPGFYLEKLTFQSS
jgi:hypothetical protein